MYRIFFVLAVLSVFVCTSADAKPIDLGDGLTVELVPGIDWPKPIVTVVRGAVKVPLGREPGALGSDDDARVRALPGNSGIEVSWEVCEHWERQRFTRPQLLAMTEHAAGHSAEALALMPDNPDYRVARVRALVNEGRRDEAIALLAATLPRWQPVVLFQVRKDPTLAPLADAPALVSWRIGSGRPTLPAYDPVRKLVMVADFVGNTMAEGPWGSHVLIIDADTGARVYRANGDASWAEIAGLLGFESALSEAPSVAPDEEPLVFDFGIKIVSGPSTAKVFAEKKLLGMVRGHVSYSADGIPTASASLFDDRIVVSGANSVGEGCGADVVGFFTTIPLTGPGPVAFQTVAATTRARRALRGGHLERALSELAAPAIQQEPAVMAFRAIVDASTDRVADAKAALASLPEPYRTAAAYDVLAPTALRPEPAARRGDAGDVPAYNPDHRTLVTRDAARLLSLVFTTPEGATRLVGFDLSPDFFANHGFMRPLASVTPQGASQGDWRAVYAGPPELRVSCANKKITFVKAGEWVGGAVCSTSKRSEVVWFFDGAAAFETTEPTERKDETISVPVTRLILAKP